VALASITDGLAWGSESKEAALERLMGLHERLVLRTAWRMLGSREDAQDAAQDVFLRLYRHLGSVDEFLSVHKTYPHVANPLLRKLIAWLFEWKFRGIHGLYRRALLKIKRDLGAPRGC